MPITFAKIKDKLKNGEYRQVMTILWFDFKEYMGKIFGESIKDILKKLIVGGCLIGLGFFGKAISDLWNPPIIEAKVFGMVADENGLPVANAKIRAKDIEGVTTSNENGLFKYKINVAKDIGYISFYCNKDGYLTTENLRQLPTDTSPYEKGTKTIHLSFQLQPSTTSHIINN